MSKGTREKVQLILTMSRQAKLYRWMSPSARWTRRPGTISWTPSFETTTPEAAVVISTHLIADIEKVLDEVIFIDRGRSSSSPRWIPSGRRRA